MSYLLKYQIPSLYFSTFRTCNDVRELSNHLPVPVVFEGFTPQDRVVSIADCTSNMVVFNAVDNSVITDSMLVENVIYKLTYCSYVGGYLLEGLEPTPVKAEDMKSLAKIMDKKGKEEVKK